jgi:UDP-N-acetylglucosamine:LPS N-acetylglucosamine transferase
MPRFMGLADFLIGKPGPGTISEAIAMNLPVIVDRNAWTLPQERYNTEWVREKQVGLVVADWKGIAGAVETLLSGDTLARYKANAAGIMNRAVFEIADILAGLIDQEPVTVPRHPGTETQENETGGIAECGSVTARRSVRRDCA